MMSYDSGELTVEGWRGRRRCEDVVEGSLRIMGRAGKFGV